MSELVSYSFSDGVARIGLDNGKANALSPDVFAALNAALEVELDDELALEDYEHNFRRMFGNERMDAVIGSVDGGVRFYGLTPTSMKLEGLDRHHRMVESLKKLHAARGRAAGLSAA